MFAASSKKARHSVQAEERGTLRGAALSNMEIRPHPGVRGSTIWVLGGERSNAVAVGSNPIERRGGRKMQAWRSTRLKVIVLLL
jgi:hypothetical protein